MKTTEGKYKMDGVMSENGFPAPGKAELRNIFAASCVESAADHEGISAAEMFVRMEAVNLFSELIYPCYETLHTQSRQIVTEDILEALHRREAKKGGLMRVYHGGTEIVEFPDISKGRAGLDFGRGFYVTDLLQQAESWADRMSRIRLEEGIVNVYEFDLQQARNAFSYKKFDNYDVEWLEYIVANRRGEYDGDLYDIVEGGVANDRVIDTVEAYMSDMMPLETALRNLSMHRPNNQLCIRNQQVVDQFLTFVESYKIQ